MNMPRGMNHKHYVIKTWKPKFNNIEVPTNVQLDLRHQDNYVDRGPSAIFTWNMSQSVNKAIMEHISKTAMSNSFLSQVSLKTLFVLAAETGQND